MKYIKFFDADNLFPGKRFLTDGAFGNKFEFERWSLRGCGHGSHDGSQEYHLLVSCRGESSVF